MTTWVGTVGSRAGDGASFGRPVVRPMAASVGVGAAALLALSVLAFWPNYLSRPAGALDGYTHLHAAAGTAWLALLLVQAVIAHRGRRALHRIVGRASFVLAPTFVASAVLLAHHRFSGMSEAVFAREAYSLYLPLSAALLFSGAYVSAVAWRHDGGVHSRCMACTGLLSIDPVVGRIMAFYLPEFPAAWLYQAITFGAEMLMVVALLRSLPASSRGRAAFRTLTGAFVIVLGMWFVVPSTPVWLAFATWFREL